MEAGPKRDALRSERKTPSVIPAKGQIFISEDVIKVKNEAIEKYRVLRGKMGSDSSYGNNGAFIIHCLATRRKLSVIASDGDEWDHVSVSISNRPNDIPTWDEMAFIKRLFWAPDECVVQYHPPEKDYVNCHPGTLHLWRPQYEGFPMPPLEMI